MLTGRCDCFAMERIPIPCQAIMVVELTCWLSLEDANHSMTSISAIKVTMAALELSKAVVLLLFCMG
jgi:hypothetical protein